MIHRLRLTSRIRCRFDDRFKWEVSGLKMTSARSRQDVCVRHFMQYGMHMYAYWYCLFTVHFHCTDVFILRIVFSESSLYTLTSCVPTPILSILYVTYCYRSECIRYCYCMYVLMVCFPPDLESFFNAFRGFLSFLCWTRNLRQQKGQELQKDSRQWSFSHFSNVWRLWVKEDQSRVRFYFSLQIWIPGVLSGEAGAELMALMLGGNELHSNCDHECVEWSIGLIIHSRLTQVTMMTCPFRQMDWDGCNSWSQWVRIVCA